MRWFRFDAVVPLPVLAFYSTQLEKAAAGLKRLVYKQWVSNPIKWPM